MPLNPSTTPPRPLPTQKTPSSTFNLKEPLLHPLNRLIILLTIVVFYFTIIPLGSIILKDGDFVNHITIVILNSLSLASIYLYLIFMVFQSIKEFLVNYFINERNNNV